MMVVLNMLPWCCLDGAGHVNVLVVLTMFCLGGTSHVGA